MELRNTKAKIRKYCALQERCESEVRRKLKEWGLDEENTNVFIKELTDFDFINEDRFTEAFVNGKFRNKKWGRIKIRAELKKRNISNYMINKHLSNIDLEVYNEVLFEILNKKNALVNETNAQKRRQKLINYTLQKGYEYELIKEAYSMLINKD